MTTTSRRDVAIAVAVTVLAVLEAALLEAGHGPVWLRLGVLLVAGAGFAARRRSPPVFAAAAGVGGLVVAAGPPVDTLAQFVFGLFAVAWCGYAGRSLLESAGAPLLVLVPALADVVAVQDAHDTAASLAWTCVLYGLAWAIGVGGDRIRMRAVRAEQVASEADGAARQLLEAAIADERRRIAQDLHDVISHGVTLMSVQAGAAARVIDDDPAAARESLVTIQRVGAQAVEELRRLLDVLRQDGEASPRSPHPDLSAAEALCATARATGLDIHLETAGDLRDVAPGASVAAYRVLQEALTNCRRHGGRCRVDVRVARDPSSLVVEVVNTAGTGGAPGMPSTGHGLAGMRERVALYGGALDAGPAGDGSWAIRARIPLPAPATVKS